MQPVSENNPKKSQLPQQDWIDLLAYVVANGRRLQREIDHCSRHSGLSESQFFLLWLTAQGPDEGSPQIELAEQLGLSAGQVSSLVEQLRRQGLLESRRAEGDRRRQLWRLTDTGQQMLQRISRQWNLPASSLSETLSPALQDALRRGLAKVGELATDAACDPVPLLRIVSEEGGVS